MTTLGAISRDIMFRDDATAVLTEHGTYTWNKAGTRIRCNGHSCGVILEAPEGPESPAVTAVFARHQAEQLPKLPEPAAEPAAPALEDPVASEVIEPAVTPEAAEVIPDPEPTPETEPAGEPLETATAETAEKTSPKVRRDTKALTATIAEISKGDRVSAGFNHPRYGMFTIEGTVVKGGAGLDRNQLMVGGWYINLNERAAKYLHELTIIAPAGKHEFAIPKPSELTEHVGIGG
jgi:hypothetical protein